MNKKILFSFSLFLMVSFCTGIFVEMVVPANIELSPNSSTFGVSLWESLKSDVFLVLLAVFFTLTISLMPCVLILVTGKTFALGFSSAYLLSTGDSGLWMLLTIISIRALIKLPLYIALTMHSYKTTKQLKNSKLQTRKNIKVYSLCLMMLCLSSLIEVLLLQIMF